jgi:hypothetical protein
MSTGSYGRLGRGETGGGGVMQLGPEMMIGGGAGGGGVYMGEGGRTKIGGCGGGGGANIIGGICGGGGSGTWKLYRRSGEGVIDLGLALLYDGLRLKQRYGLGLRL